MTNLKCPICGGNDGTQMYGVVICKAALAKANAENEALQSAIRERDSLRAQGEADWNACCDALVWTRSFPRDSPPPSRAVVAVLERLKTAEEKVASEKARADKAERDLGECLAATNEVLKDALEQGKEADAPNQALVKAVRAAYRLGAEEMRTRAADEAASVLGAGWGIVTRIRTLPVPGDAS